MRFLSDLTEANSFTYSRAVRQIFLAISFILCLALLTACEQGEQNKSPGPDPVVQFVDPFIGTGGEGHTYPGATVPYGMVQLSPDTRTGHFRGSFPWCAGYQYGDSIIHGFSHTHFSGTGHSDLGDVLLMPVRETPLLITKDGEKPKDSYKSVFFHDREKASPGYYSVYLADHEILAELTSTVHTGFHRYTFDGGRPENAGLVVDLISSIYNYDDKVTWTQIRVINDSLVSGMRQTRGWAPNRYLYFAIRFSEPFDSYTITNEEQPEYNSFWKRGQVFEDQPEVFGKKIRAFFRFGASSEEQLLVKVGISAVDALGAIQNLDKEIPGWDFDQVKNNARDLWQEELSRVTIESDDVTREIFYTALYHTMLAPVQYADVDGRYRGLDLAIHNSKKGGQYTIWSLWDTYRATHPLFTILQPDRTSDMIRSLIDHYQQSAFGILPVWAFHSNETFCMIGYHAVSVIGDAYLKGLRDYDTELALEAVLSSSSYRPYDGLGHYIDYGYVPIDLENEGASKTLEYAYDDWVIARMAESMGKEEISREYYNRAMNYRNIFDTVTGFMRARNSDGTFREPFDPLYAQYGGDYTEGNAWQYTWYVPHDVQGLIDLMGGKETFVRKLDSLFVIEGDEEKYRHVEDIAGLIGQYAHGNEPSQHIAYLYNYAGYSWKTQERVHQVMNGLFDNTPYGISGNEDCGQMSAWYIFTSMGFYPVCPGSGEYVIGSPCIPAASVNFENGKVFTMIAEGLSDENIYIQSATLNGTPLERCYITHKEIIEGGHLAFKMGPGPNKELWASPGSTPYSLSKNH